MEGAKKQYKDMNTVPKPSAGQSSAASGANSAGTNAAPKPNVGYQGGAAGGVTPNTY